MKLTTERTTYALLPALVAVALGGCDKLTPNGTSGTIALLRAGSEQACVAAEVQDDLRGLILPKPQEFGADPAGGDAQAAIGSVSVAFDATTLQATDKSVSKVTCTTNARVTGAGGSSGRFRISYDVSPSAEIPTHVVVSADTDDARAFARTQVSTALEKQGAAQEQQQAAQAAQAQETSTRVTPDWLVGTWVDEDTLEPSCATGENFTFRPDHRVHGSDLDGRWFLTGNKLRAEGGDGAAELTGTIIILDASSFNLLYSFGGQHTFHRCAPEEMRPAGSSNLPDSVAPVDPAQPSQFAPN